MQQILSYLNEFLQQTNKVYLLCCTLFAALLVAANYKWGIETKMIQGIASRTARFGAFYLLYLTAFSVPYLICFLLGQKPGHQNLVITAVLVAPAIFAIKVTAGGWHELLRSAFAGSTGRILALLVDWPLRLVITVSLLWVLKKLMFPGTNEVYGLTTRNFSWWPYLLLLAFMVPLVAFAATRPDFLHAYPKVKVLDRICPPAAPLWQKLVYELSYGSDFLTIELFFRGFLVVALSRYVGTAAILPMAVFYCSIHFGKPMLECISSYFGGIILGAVACYSQSIFGGIVVHLGLAWMMELAAAWRSGL